MSNNDAENPEIDLSRFQLLHEVFRHRAADPIQRPLMAFPKSGFADYEYFTGKVLDQFTDTAAWHYAKANIQTPTGLSRVALLGPTNLEWVVSFFGLSRAGYTVLTLSPRLSAPAIVKLMQETHCECLIYHESPKLLAVMIEVVSLMSLQTLPILSRHDYDTPKGPAPPFERDIDVAEERRRPATISHSSGSTGLPKPIEVVHERYTMAYAIGPGDRDFVTLPLYHSFALYVCPARMYQRKTVFFLNPHLPLTCEGLTAAIREARPGTLCAVPYVLKLLAEQKSGIDALKQIDQVVFTGSQCPDDLGDQLVEKGVNLATLMGSSECGFLGTSIGRPADDKAWNYLRPPPALMKDIYPKPIAADTFEFVFLKNHPGRNISNSDDPPNSFHSRDIFTPHKTIPGAWKFLGRIDDRVTLMNGEKVLPLPIEGSIRQHKLVREAVVFGIGRVIPGLLVFRSQTAKDLGDKDFIETVWPIVDAANCVAEGFSQIGVDMIVPMPAGVSIPLTDKGSIIRAQVYNVFAKEIEEAYACQEGTIIMDGAELETHLLSLGQQILGPQLSDPKDDLFTLGMNSLQAIQMRGFILRDLYLGGNGRKLSQNLVFENGNIANLAKHLEDVRSSQSVVKEKPIAVMKDLISKFSAFEKHIPGANETCKTHTIILTGATGGVGAHILTLLLNQPTISQIYCLIRGADPLPRLQKSFQDKRLPPLSSPKLRILASDLSDPHLGLSPADYTTLKSSTTHIIHCAWPVNFQLGLPSFIPSLHGLQNLIQLSLSGTLPMPARLIFCSSISVALGTPGPTRIPEAPIKSLEQVSQTGYAASKLVGEQIVQAAVENHGARATVLRIGQVVGDTKAGVWNDTEAFPLIIRSAVTMGVLPEMDTPCQWLPVDTLAEAVLEVVMLRDGQTSGAAAAVSGREGQLFYNLRSPHTFSWTPDLCSALHATDLSAFENVTFKDWLDRLRSLSADTHSSTGGKTSEAADPNRNPAIKLVDFFAENFAENNANSEVVFEIGEAEKASPALRNAPKVIESGLLGKMVEVWMERWMGKRDV
ncbi:hypothetical protein HO133_007191 [Letharia lupina]|uniref:Carrier domain-containing protein n=1 Tax=Letharia lupina TaxID=560253 RepID=A0A8H6FIE7_9LECA|nr:uncharacterized protein HO133_007191 [Letharia lupina]KAF6229077.1 hypothetical protein HO133_007191 [Letharia lupina]